MKAKMATLFRRVAHYWRVIVIDFIVYSPPNQRKRRAGIVEKATAFAQYRARVPPNP